MLIIGAKGFAKEILHICKVNYQNSQIAFFDDINTDIGDFIYEEFKIVKSLAQALEYFNKIDNKFTLGIGNPLLRQDMYNKFSSIGGLFTSTISHNADIGSYNVELSDGINILSGVKISNDVKIGKGVMIYYNSVITHDVIIKDFVEISPSVTILGRAVINENTQIGSGSIILPDVIIGQNVLIGAGSVVTSNLPNNCIAYGVPAKIINYK